MVGFRCLVSVAALSAALGEQCDQSEASSLMQAKPLRTNQVQHAESSAETSLAEMEARVSGKKIFVAGMRDFDSEDLEHSAPVRTWPKSLNDKYELVRQLSCGFHGCAYFAKDLAHDGKQIVIKLSDASGGSSQGAGDTECGQMRFIRYLACNSTDPDVLSLQETYLPTCLDTGTTEEGYNYLVLPMAGGMKMGDIRLDFYKKDNPWDLETRQSFFAQLVAALYSLHAAGVSHNDLHGGNIVVDEDTKQLSILDFGLASRTPCTLGKCRSGYHRDGNSLFRWAAYMAICPAKARFNKYFWWFSAPSGPLRGAQDRCLDCLRDTFGADEEFLAALGKVFEANVENDPFQYVEEVYRTQWVQSRLPQTLDKYAYDGVPQGCQSWSEEELESRMTEAGTVALAEGTNANRPLPIKDGEDIELTWDIFAESLGANWLSQFVTQEGSEIAGEVLETAESLSAAQERCVQLSSCGGVEESDGAIALVGYGVLKRKRGSRVHIAGRLQHLDFYRCVSFLSRGDFERYDSMRDPESLEETGEWSCVSALLRRGTLGVLDEIPEDTRDIEVRDESHGIGTKSLSHGGDWEGSLSWQPLLCDLARRAGRKNCRVTGFGLEDFRRLRELAPTGQVDSSLLQSVRAGPLLNLSPGAGRSGSTFASAFDGTYKVKLGLLRVQFVGINEARHLMKLVTGEDRQTSPGPTPPLEEHYQQHPESTINHVYGMLRLDFGGIKSYCIWMEDAGYKIENQLALADPAAGQPQPEVRRYDMKRWHPKQRKDEDSFTLEAGNFIEDEGHLPFGDDGCLHFRRVLRADNEYLFNHKTIDYSYFIEVVRNASALECDAKAPLCSKHGDTIYTFSIIDTVRDYDVARDALAISKIWDKYNGGSQRFANQLCPTAREQRLTDTYYKKFNEYFTDRYFRKDCVDTDIVECGYMEAADESGSVTWEGMKKFCRAAGIRYGKFKKNWQDIASADDFVELFA